MSPSDNQHNAGSQTHDWILRAKRELDEIFGEGYAKDNPQLVGDYIKCAAVVEQTYYIYEIQGHMSSIAMDLNIIARNM